MGEQFRLEGESKKLGRKLEKDFGCLDEFSGADDLNRVLHELRGAGVLECYDLLGLARDGGLVLAESGEMTDIFCLACEEEISDVEGPEGPVSAGGAAERRA